MTAKVIFSISDQSVTKMKVVISARERSRVVAMLLEKEVSAREQNLYLCAKALEESTGLKREIATRDRELGRDGLGELSSYEMNSVNDALR